MKIIDENYKQHLIKSIDEPISVDYFWVVDLQEKDFMLNKLVMLEEFNAPSLTISIQGERIQIPAEWNILVYSPETSDVDMVQISDLTTSDFTIFLYNLNSNKVIETTCRVVDYSTTSVFRVPSFNKSNMLCYPIGNSYCIMIAPTDTYNKYLKESTTVGNFLY